MAFHNDHLMNQMKLHAASQIQSYSFCRFGRVRDYDPDTNLYKVAFFNPKSGEYDLLSGWIQHIMATVGRGDDSDAETGDTWGFVSPANMNEQVVVMSHNGDFTRGMIIGAHYTEPVPPPVTDDEQTQMGEFLWMHKSGSYLKFWNNGDVTMYAAGGINMHSDNNISVRALGDIQLVADGAIVLDAGIGIDEIAKSQITLDAPVVNTTNNLSVGTGATGTFTTGYNIVTVSNGIVTLIV